ncbi:Ig-like domain-containing protein [Ethanoligenens sp.]|uniref:Ig-like domain-containing protein n=1 Tax=Ethanoligenens sp. TaxID=2099655 RepID=UPI0039ED180D
MRKKYFLGFCSLVLIVLLAGRTCAAEPLFVTAPHKMMVDVGLQHAEVLRASPSSAALGIDCGMADMCGIDPCTCGSPDEWGHCACNGTKKTPVSYKVMVDDPKVASVTVSGAKLTVKGLSAGQTNVTVTAHLQHYTDAVQTITVTVNSPFYLFWILPVAAVAAVLLLWMFKRKKKGKR